MPGLRGGCGTDGRGSSGCGAAPSLGDRGRAAISRDGGKFTADAIGTDDTGSGRGFSFFLFFFLPLLLGVKLLGSCYTSHAVADSLRAWCCDAASLEWLGARCLPQSEPWM